LTTIRADLLIVVTLLLPLGWGCVVHWLLSRVWPVKEAAGDDRPLTPRAHEHPIDYQI